MTRKDGLRRVVRVQASLIVFVPGHRVVCALPECALRSPPRDSPRHPVGWRQAALWGGFQFPAWSQRAARRDDARDFVNEALQENEDLWLGYLQRKKANVRHPSLSGSLHNTTWAAFGAAPALHSSVFSSFEERRR